MMILAQNMQKNGKESPYKGEFTPKMDEIPSYNA